MFLFQYEKLVTGGVLVKRPSKQVKSPYVADITIEDNEELAHCPSLGISGLFSLIRLKTSFADSIACDAPCAKVGRKV